MIFVDKFKRFKNDENYYLLFAVFFCIALRILTPQMIGGGGNDAVESWDMARRLLFGEGYYFIHRTARFGTIVPVYLTQLLFGTHPLVYYIAPAIASVIQVLFLFKIAKIIRGSFFAFVVVILYLSFPQMIRELSHPRVSVFSTMFLLISFYYALRFYTASTDRDSEKSPRMSDLLISGTCVFFLYLAKEDSLYFLPALMMIVFFSRKRFFDLVIFAVIPLSLFISETLIYHFFTEFTYGRLSVIAGTGKHFDTVPPLPSWLSLFDRFKGVNLRPYFRYPLIISLIGGIYIFATRLRDDRKRINPVVFIVIALVLYIFFLTFLVKSIHPIVPLNTFRTRYMNIIIPLMILIIAYFVSDISGRLRKGRLSDNNDKVTASVLSGRKMAVLLVVIVFYTALTTIFFHIVYKKEMYKGLDAGYLEMHPFRLVYSYSKIISEGYDSGRPLAVHGVKERVNRFADVVETIESWTASGMTLQQACVKYGISVEKYHSYRVQTEERISYDALMYLEDIFLYRRGQKTSIGTIDAQKKGSHYKLVFNSRVTDKSMAAGYFQSGSDVIFVAYPPFTVTVK